MKASKQKRSVLPKKVRDAYWRTVVDCLVHLHRLVRSDATTQANDRREHYEDLWYNTEEFDVANGIAGNDLAWDSHRKAYFEIKERNYARLQAGENGKE